MYSCNQNDKIIILNLRILNFSAKFSSFFFKGLQNVFFKIRLFIILIENSYLYLVEKKIRIRRFKISEKYFLLQSW